MAFGIPRRISRSINTAKKAGTAGTTTKPPLVSGTYIPNSQTSKAIPPILTGSFVGAGGTAFNTTPPSDVTAQNYAGGLPPPAWSTLGKQMGLPQGVQQAPSYLTKGGGAPANPANDPMMAMLEALLSGQNSQPSPAVGQVTAGQIPRTDISGLYGQFSPQISSGFDQLVQDLTSRQAGQQQSFQGVLDRLKQSYGQTGQDVAAGTKQAQGDLQQFAQQMNLGPALEGKMNQRWMTDAGRLQNLAGQAQAAQTGSVDTLSNALTQLFGMNISGAKGAKATALADLASRIATGQSNIDVARATGQTDLNKAALEGNTGLLQAASAKRDNAFSNQMDILELMERMRGTRADEDIARQRLQLDKDQFLTQRMTDQQTATQKALSGLGGSSSLTNQAVLKNEQRNPGIEQALSSIPDREVQQIVTDFWQLAGGDLNRAIGLMAKEAQAQVTAPEQFPLDPSDPKSTPILEQWVSEQRRREKFQQAIAVLMQYAPNFGGLTTTATGTQTGKS